MIAYSARSWGLKIVPINTHPKNMNVNEYRSESHEHPRRSAGSGALPARRQSGFLQYKSRAFPHTAAGRHEGSRRGDGAGE